MTTSFPALATALLLVTGLASAHPAEQEKAGKRQQLAERVEYPTEDEVTVYADLYERRARPGAAVLVLFHDSTGSRGEVRPTLKRFQDLGYVCMAVDLRVGGRVSKVMNFTATGFPEGHEGQNTLEAEHDIVASLHFARVRFPDRRVVAIGCSFSASHALRLAGLRPELVDGVVAFSPAEYFSSRVESETFVQDAMVGVHCPVLILSARAEIEEWTPLLDAMPSTAKRSFVPDGRGRHGFRALWKETAEGEQYWLALESFLRDYFAPPSDPTEGVEDDAAQETSETREE